MFPNESHRSEYSTIKYEFGLRLFSFGFYGYVYYNNTAIFCDDTAPNRIRLLCWDVLTFEKYVQN